MATRDLLPSIEGRKPCWDQDKCNIIFKIILAVRVTSLLEFLFEDIDLCGNIMEPHKGRQPTGFY